MINRLFLILFCQMSKGNLMGKKSHSLNGDEKLDVHIIKSK